MEKIEEILEKKFKSYEKRRKSYLAANNELLSKRLNEVNGKLNDLQVSIEHSDKVNLEKFKATDRDASHINGIFRNHAKNTRNKRNNQLYEIKEKLRYLEDSSRRYNLRIEGFEEEEEEETDNETWDQCEEKVSSILKSKNYKIYNVKIEQDHIISRKKAAITKANLVP